MILTTLNVWVLLSVLSFTVYKAQLADIILFYMIFIMVYAI
jgi:hypothetical protein